MANRIDYKGWRRFGDTGEAYRWWKVNKDIKEWGAEAGDELLDHGHPTAKRFDLRREQKTIARFGERRFRRVLPGLPPWRPPREDNEALTKAMKAIASALQDLVCATDRKTEAERKLAEVRKAVDGTKADPKEGTARANAYLRMVREDTYRGGDPFTDWELLVDVPGVPVRPGSPGKAHIQAGDILREEGDDRLTPFLLKRDGKEVASPEWWQVRHLFVGLKDDAEEHLGESGEGNETPQAPDERARLLAIYEALMPGDDGTRGHVLYAERGVAGTIVRPGDYMVNHHGFNDRDPIVQAAVLLRVPRVQISTVEAQVGDAVSILRVESHPYSTEAQQLKKLRRRLARRPNSSWKDSTSPLVIVRPLVPSVTEPIQATSDDAALFELLHQVGGRMPFDRSDE